MGNKIGKVQVTPEEYRIKINNLNTNFNLALDEIVHSYPISMINPTVDSYRNTLIIDQDNLENIKSKIFLTKNYLTKDLNTINKKTYIYNFLINIFNENNDKLIKKLNTLENQNNASTGELELTKEKYNITAFENSIFLFLSIILIIISGYQFKNNIKT